MCRRSYLQTHLTDFYHFWPTIIIYDADNAADGILKYSNFFGYFIPKKLVFWLFFSYKFRAAQFQPNNTTQMHQNKTFTSVSDGDDARSFKMPIF